MTLPTRAMIMAAGLGTRMRPLTNDRPKPMVTVRGRTLIDHTLDRLVAAGVKTVVVNLHYRADMLKAHLDKRRDIEVRYSDETGELLGTGGGVRRAMANFMDEPFFILNSDSVVFFKQKDPDYIEGQKLLAHLIMSPKFQTVFNQAKGSIPARMDVDLSQGFNSCQQLSLKDLQASIAGGTLVRPMAHNMTILQKYRGAIMDTITAFVNDPKMTPKEAANAMADGVDAQK